jgi:hypothetical protein
MPAPWALAVSSLPASPWHEVQLRVAAPALCGREASGWQVTQLTPACGEAERPPGIADAGLPAGLWHIPHLLKSAAYAPAAIAATANVTLTAEFFIIFK